MAGLTIQPSERSVIQILQAGFYRIPRFQRPYAWDAERLDDFWVDVFEDNDAGYFIGPMVFFAKTSQDYGIVDGQQRLATITIALCALRDVSSALGRMDFAQGMQYLVERTDPNSNDIRRVLTNEDDLPYFANWIQPLDKPDVLIEPTQSERRLEAAYEFLRTKISSAVVEVQNDDSVSESTRKRRATVLLKEYRRKLQELKVLWVELGNEDDAYIVFETLNSRGMDLGVSDLLKNHLLGHLRKITTDSDPYRHKWNQVLGELRGSSQHLDPDEFILHWWLSRAEFVARKKLFKVMKRAITQQDAANQLNSLATDAKRYRSIREPESRPWSATEIALEASLRALRTFGVVQPMPFVLAVIRAWEDSKITYRRAREALWTVERFHFESTAVASRSSSGGVSHMYARHAEQLTKASDRSVSTAVIQDLQGKLDARLPTRAEFMEGFRQLYVTSDHTRDRTLVQYILGRMHAHFMPSFPLNPRACSMEHLKPQSDISISYASSVIGQLGNLMLVANPLNDLLGSKGFQEKRRILLSSDGASAWVDDQIRNATRWDKAAIERRTDVLAEKALDDVWTPTAPA